jgi:hypothetical protein
MPTRSTHSIPRVSSFSRIRAQFPTGRVSSKRFSGFTHMSLCIVEFVGKHCTSSNTTFLTSALRLSWPRMPCQPSLQPRPAASKRTISRCNCRAQPPTATLQIVKWAPQIQRYKLIASRVEYVHAMGDRGRSGGTNHAQLGNGFRGRMLIGSSVA